MTGTQDGRTLTTLPTATDDRPAAVVGDKSIVRNDHLTDRYWRLVLDAPRMARSTLPGQFVMITPARPEETWPVLPRPMAVYDTDPDAGTITVVYGVVGPGTRHLSRFRPGERLLTVGPLGRAFTLPRGTESLLVLGRGIGTCSLTMLAAESARCGVAVTAVASGRGSAAIVGVDTFRRAGATVHAVHDDEGSSSPERLWDLLSAGPAHDVVAVCGSNRLMALAARLGARSGAQVLVSLEAHMACGLGYCHGCATGERTAGAESPLICRDGPVFALVGSEQP